MTRRLVLISRKSNNSCNLFYCRKRINGNNVPSNIGSRLETVTPDSSITMHRLERKRTGCLVSEISMEIGWRGRSCTRSFLTILRRFSQLQGANRITLLCCAFPKSPMSRMLNYLNLSAVRKSRRQCFL